MTASRPTSTCSIARNGRVSQLTRTPENENSPTPLPAGIGEPGGFSVVQSEMRPPDAKPGPIQRLWRFNASGASPQLILADINPVGYHAWVDADRLALFVLGQPNSLQLASVKTGKGEVAANGIGRSLHRIPGTRLVSFVHREASEEFFIKQIDMDSKKIDTLTKVVEGSTERDMAWTARRQDHPDVGRHEGVFVDARRDGLDRSVRRRAAQPRRRLAAGRVAERRCDRYCGGGTSKK